MAVGEIAEDVGLARRGERPALRHEPVAKEAEIAPVRLERVLRQPILEPEVIAELVEEHGVARSRRTSFARKTRSGFARHGGGAPSPLPGAARRAHPGNRIPSWASSHRLIAMWKPSSFRAKPPIPPEAMTRWHGIASGK